MTAPQPIAKMQRKKREKPERSVSVDLKALCKVMVTPDGTTVPVS
jgi:hypothetical protein